MDPNNQKDRERFGAVMKGLSVNSDVEITDDMMRLYSRALKGFDIGDIERAGVAILKTWEYSRMPPLAVIIKHINGEAQPIEDRGLVMAHQIVSHVKQWGASKFPDLQDDPIAMELMTRRWKYDRWASLVLESELHWWVKEFAEAYTTYSESDNHMLITGSRKVKQLADGLFEDA